MKKIVKLTESDLTRIVKRVLMEQTNETNLKKLRKDGYDVNPGTMVDEKKPLYDMGEPIVANTISAAELQLNQVLKSKNLTNRDGYIVSKNLPNKNVEVKFFKFKP